MTLTGKTIGELAQLSSVTEDTLFAVEYSGKTFNLPYSAFSPTYKVYIALLTQSGENEPVVNVIENTLDLNITWVRNTVGQYYGGDISSKCPDNKTVYIVSDASNGINLYGVPLKQVHLWTYGNDIPQTARNLNLSVTTVNNSGDITFADWDSPKVILIEIRVYN